MLQHLPVPVSKPPPPPPSSGVGVYAIGALALAGAIVAILMLKCEDAKPLPPAPPPAVTTEEPVQMRAPPAPPEKTADPVPTAEEPDAGPDDAGPVATGTGKFPAGGFGACDKCGQGVSNGALQSAVQSAAGSARGCYNRVISKSGGGAEGKMTVRVNVGANGAVCSASIANDTVNSPPVSSCVLNRFQGKSFPKPDKGCVTVNVPLNFTVKKD